MESSQTHPLTPDQRKQTIGVKTPLVSQSPEKKALATLVALNSLDHHRHLIVSSGRVS